MSRKRQQAAANQVVSRPTAIERLFAQALSLHQQAFLADAELLYMKILERDPCHVATLQLMGMVAVQTGRNDIAESFLRKAIGLKDSDPTIHFILTGMLLEQDKLEQAMAHCMRALALKPNFAEAYLKLGDIFQRLGKLPESESSCRQALKLKPDYAEAHNNLGNVLNGLGRFDDAVASYSRALEIRPDYAEAYNNLGVTLEDLERSDEAEASHRRALELKPDFAEAHNNLGNVLGDQGRFAEAEANYRRALEIKPDYAEAHSNLGNVLNGRGRFDDAVASYSRSLEIRPDYAEAHNNLGITLKDLGRSDEAEASHRRALELKPDFAEAHNNLGIVLSDQGRFAEAEASHRRALEIRPDYAEAQSNLLFCLNYHPDLSVEEIYRAYQEYDASFGIPLRSTWRTHTNDKTPDRRLRVGYVSPDFRYHSCRFFLEPLLAHHDKTQVEVYAYAELSKKDDMTARYQSYVERWIPTKGMGDEALAERIRSDGIDILVDLAGHTAHNRLLTFARKPAPVSVSWLGYGNTTGLRSIDYYLTDATSVPVGSEGSFAEQPWYIANPPYSYRPTAGMGEVSGLPALRCGHITFGTLTRSVRINPHTIRVWSEILRRVEGSRLVIDSLNFNYPGMQARLVEGFAEHGVTRERLELGYHSPPWDILRGIDISLDCFPHNSGTTLLESLYMGVPYVTLASRPGVGRLGSSILKGVGHPEWIAQSEAEYVDKAVALATDLPGLAALRVGLRSEMEASPLMDEAEFARKVEAAYRMMFANWAES
ncbi:tetratricopeptide repeat protein [Ferrovum myxofaciens]|jgi:predicted O-linked N-acetylglucosamine transferase (SPINDLY family)|uniref:protein O-GlcNAc transferase n=1 Tax=Ferrovum myxofaciens TaxID=416213 RepID=A0A9E6MX21_9PROT|nr:glycosyltransferase family 41 protein [Ferrovum myxofaciens]QKE39767.2 MAG: tetratricopeptide repeat protein [Ferrovum myxofaciens]QWY73818.1 MAG: tetratricopeptide repeat protein [Ferrovum myxofaciens]QWY76572.1 MAG: tetratricopeptide repeat protein [Ferrovum myxofaciens]